MNPIPVITIIGLSGSGKTTLLEKLIRELKQRGYRIATIKHHSHAGFEVDQPGKDSWRFAQAGSDHVVIAAPDKIASYRTLDRELRLDEIVADITDVDIILVEGYRHERKPTLEVVGSNKDASLISHPADRFAIASDAPLEVGVPWFHRDDVPGIADFIERLFLNQSQRG
jgi:molybdopterin-guanine dinucleotide biosynthesis protein MobB